LTAGPAASPTILPFTYSNDTLAKVAAAEIGRAPVALCRRHGRLGVWCTRARRRDPEAEDGVVDPALARTIAHFNKRFTNRLTRPLAPHLPGFGVVAHTGRKSGRRYETPVNVFARDDGFVIALTYGRESDWVKNVLAAGGCGLTTRGRSYQLTNPEIFQDERRGAGAAVARPILRMIGAADFMRLRRAA
jgi:deazaflavin-dependent oxidoreductase (nitroreductase family)